MSDFFFALAVVGCAWAFAWAMVKMSEHDRDANIAAHEATKWIVTTKEGEKP